MTAFFTDKPAIEAHLLDIERTLTGPSTGDKKPTLRDRLLAKGVVFLAGMISKRTLDLHQEHEIRIRALEQRATTPFFWTWTAGDQFDAGAFVTHRGGLWQSAQPVNKDEPGTSTAWTLIVGSAAA